MSTIAAEVSVETGVMDCDTHCWQPRELWEPFIDPEHRSAVVAFDEESDPLGKSLIDPAVEAKLREQRAIPASDDPIERLRWMDAEGIYLNVIYPNASWFSYAQDRDVAAAGCRALNRWAASFADADRSRLKPTMMLPVLHPDLALEEFRYASEELGLTVVFAAPTPHRDRRWSDASFDPLWSAIQQSGTVMTFHEFTRLDTGEMPLVARPCYQDNYAISYLCGHAVECQLALTDLIGGGVFDRFPELRVGLVEGHVAWLPGWLALMDDLWPRISTRFAATEGTGTLEMRPTEYFRRQCFVVAFPDDAWIRETVEYVGPETVVLSSDFPHPNSARRTPVRDVFYAANESLDPKVQHRIMNGNARAIFTVT